MTAAVASISDVVEQLVPRAEGCTIGEVLACETVRAGRSAVLCRAVLVHQPLAEPAAQLFVDPRAFDGRRQTSRRGVLLRTGPAQASKLAGTFGVVQLGMVLHIWDLEGQTKACERVVELLRAEKSVLVVGQRIGNLVGNEFPARGTTIFKHDAETFAIMWEEVGRRTGTESVVRA
ncbi:hypothetical protein B0H63DRAFT_536509 [Podospora didyma]|uniref:Uncharacterized protein n=1 Tax=Podospora didyma TaxID=330526 RepID=A0AAE0JXY8_9PEZI|nr:hypothetical protein B0H63DRAFT_536509 [Podospora didyma]